MKVFICAIAVFLLLCAFVSINATIVCQRIDQLIEGAKNLPKEPDTALSDRLIGLWDEHERIISMTANHTACDRIELALYELKNASDASSYNSRRDSLLVLLKDLRDSAALSLSRII